LIEHNAGLAKYAGPGGWNDMDFLMTGRTTGSKLCTHNNPISISFQEGQDVLMTTTKYVQA